MLPATRGRSGARIQDTGTQPLAARAESDNTQELSLICSNLTNSRRAVPLCDNPSLLEAVSERCELGSIDRAGRGSGEWKLCGADQVHHAVEMGKHLGGLGGCSTLHHTLAACIPYHT